LRDEGVNSDGEAVEHRPQYFLGAAVSPYAALPRYEAIITEKKINAGAQFLQTMPIFDQPRFIEWLEALDKRDLLGKAYLMPTVAPLKSPRHARFMANEVPGVYLPPHLMARIEQASDPQEEGIQIALDLITELKAIGGIHGLHILAPGQEEVVPRLVRETGLKDFAPGGRTFSGNGRHKSHGSEGRGFHLPKFAHWPVFNPKDSSGTESGRNIDL
jgi:5,10-methylenetetrahydrofolate reductase